MVAREAQKQGRSMAKGAPAHALVSAVCNASQSSDSLANRKLSSNGVPNESMEIQKRKAKEKKERKRKERRQREAALKAEAKATGLLPRQSAQEPSKRASKKKETLPNLEQAPFKRKGKNRVFVGHLAQSTSEASLCDLFQHCGQVVEVDMLYRTSTGRFKGSAFVAFKSAKNVLAALKLNGTMLEGKQIVVQPEQHSAPESVAPHKEKSPTLAAKSSRSVFVGNVPAGADERGLRNTFRECGPIQRVKLLPAVKGIRPAFIDFREAKAAEDAVKLDGKFVLNGNALQVGYSMRKAAPLSSRRSQDARKRRREKRDDARGVLALKEG
mmetsp:Transcript_45257/g.94321  ORF Transcript_45257/g.94321 Transcript_45257/m.94321 type:complete len:327 (+) Transcript_45257:243-1223(+)